MTITKIDYKNLVVYCAVVACHDTEPAIKLWCIENDVHIDIDIKRQYTLHKAWFVDQTITFGSEIDLIHFLLAFG